MSMEDGFRPFEGWLDTTRTLGERTKVEYRDDVARLVNLLTRTCRVTAITGVNRAHLVRYLDALATAGQAANTRRRVIAASRLFLRN